MVAVEDEVQIGVCGQPDILGQLVLELALAPTGVAEQQRRSPRAADLVGHRGQGLARAGHGQTVAEGQGVLADAPVIRMQNKAAFTFDRAAHQDGAADRLFRRMRLQLVQHGLQIHAASRPVDSQSHGVIRSVGADQNHGVFEPGVADAGHGDQ